MDEEKSERLRESAEKMWGATRKTLQTATFRANQYKQIVQKKIDLGSLHKKISTVYADLGRLIDEYREEGSNVLEREEVQALLRKLDSYKNSAATLEEEIEAIKLATPPQPDTGEESEQDR